jgi:hypothetical protein
MFGKGMCHEEEALLREIIRSINKRSRFTLHVSHRGHQADIVLDLENLKAARTDTARRHQIRQRIKARYDHLGKSRYGDDILGLKPAKLLRASPRPEPSTQPRGFARAPRR